MFKSFLLYFFTLIGQDIETEIGIKKSNGSLTDVEVEVSYLGQNQSQVIKTRPNCNQPLPTTTKLLFMFYLLTGKFVNWC